jgi:hypothetical protein
MHVGTLKTGCPRIQALSQDKEQCVHPRTATQAVALDHTSLQRWASEPPRVPWPWTSPPCSGELRCCHMARGLRPRLLAELSSGAATRSSAPDLASLPRWALALPRVPWLRALLGTCVERRELLPTPLRGHTACLSLKKSVSRSV